ncbi:Adenylate kinase [Cardinium endosymbiont cEper1 of Encarsia pergandiella]|uniref:adenylate kinase n=1 Tax=Cardinium endosymbiont of Encarsia pergandiella TaxID=249402 RepID=UPI00027E9E03|nr:adenylate kinase [Cardinium endosymbiont of Encarsia pergandiella]CCM10058.1 Adenylate kinase [Cardinium endosymbiont cEper1 of Encarsia pergandiella]
MLNIILVGPPGSGKGTQAERMIQKYGFISIALGALLRQQIAENGANKSRIEAYINNGQLVPDDISFQIIRELIETKPSDESLLLDGFPRTIVQATFLDNCLVSYHAKIDGVILLDVPNVHLLKRLRERATIEARPDDQDDDKIKARMHIYQQKTLPMLNYYQHQNKLYRVDGTQAIDEVTKAIETIIDRLKL